MKHNNVESNIYSGFDISNLKLIGQGRQGKVYELTDNKVLKVYFRKSSCKRQLEILSRTQVSRFFPKVFNHDAQSVVMELIHGTTLLEYLEKNQINKGISTELAKLINEFIALGFTRIDIRLAHIFVQADETIKAIDPRGSYKIVQPYPLLMMKGLKYYNALESFLSNISIEYPDYYNYWSTLTL